MKHSITMNTLNTKNNEDSSMNLMKQQIYATDWPELRVTWTLQHRKLKSALNLLQAKITLAQKNDDDDKK
jgi:hypothetical protein